MELQAALRKLVRSGALDASASKEQEDVSMKNGESNNSMCCSTASGKGTEVSSPSDSLKTKSKEKKQSKGNGKSRGKGSGKRKVTKPKKGKGKGKVKVKGKKKSKFIPSRVRDHQKQQHASVSRLGKAIDKFFFGEGAASSSSSSQQTSCLQMPRSIRARWMDEMVVDHLWRVGREDAAMAFERESGVRVTHQQREAYAEVRRLVNSLVLDRDVNISLEWLASINVQLGGMLSPLVSFGSGASPSSSCPSSSSTSSSSHSSSHSDSPVFSNGESNSNGSVQACDRGKDMYSKDDSRLPPTRKRKRGSNGRDSNKHRQNRVSRESGNHFCSMDTCDNGELPKSPDDCIRMEELDPEFYVSVNDLLRGPVIPESVHRRQGEIERAIVALRFHLHRQRFVQLLMATDNACKEDMEPCMEWKRQARRSEKRERAISIRSAKRKGRSNGSSMMNVDLWERNGKSHTNSDRGENAYGSSLLNRCLVYVCFGAFPTLALFSLHTLFSFIVCFSLFLPSFMLIFSILSIPLRSFRWPLSLFALAIPSHLGPPIHSLNISHHFHPLKPQTCRYAQEHLWEFLHPKEALSVPTQCPRPRPSRLHDGHRAANGGDEGEGMGQDTTGKGLSSMTLSSPISFIRAVHQLLGCLAYCGGGFGNDGRTYGTKLRGKGLLDSPYAPLIIALRSDHAWVSIATAITRLHCNVAALKATRDGAARAIRWAARKATGVTAGRRREEGTQPRRLGYASKGDNEREFEAQGVDSGGSITSSLSLRSPLAVVVDIGSSALPALEKLASISRRFSRGSSIGTASDAATTHTPSAAPLSTASSSTASSSSPASSSADAASIAVAASVNNGGTGNQGGKAKGSSGSGEQGNEGEFEGEGHKMKTAAEQSVGMFLFQSRQPPHPAFSLKCSDSAEGTDIDGYSSDSSDDLCSMGGASDQGPEVRRCSNASASSCSFSSSDSNSWLQYEELPMELPVPRLYRYHSIFSCPVSRDVGCEDNPPVLLKVRRAPL